MIVECPVCHAKFRVDDKLITKPQVMMKCSKCSYTFEFQKPAGLEKIVGMPKPKHEELQKEQTETPTPVKEKSSKLPGSWKDGKGALINPKWLDEDHAEMEFLTKDMRNTNRALWIGLILIFILAGAGVWILRDRLFGPSVEQELSDKGIPLFNIPEEKVTYEVLYHPNEGPMLVIRGAADMLVKDPVKSIQIQARVYDKDKNLLAASESYAGIVLKNSDLINSARADMETLLGTEQDISSLSNQEGAPFVIVFWGDVAKNGASFQIEVVNWS
jgi:predicted Zn finger-like uncharacterized protein